jgi:hypothetical protein
MRYWKLPRIRHQTGDGAGAFMEGNPGGTTGMPSRLPRPLPTPPAEQQHVLDIFAALGVEYLRPVLRHVEKRSATTN